jgi:hypothetical protein
MTPRYEVRIWPEDGWWLARVMAASDGADPSPLNAMTQARSVARIEAMGRDLIATVLDTDEDAFDVSFEYQLPGASRESVAQAKAARAWLEAAQDLWQERSAAAARALADEGYSLRETAALLGLSHQRVDQILARHHDRKRNDIVLITEGSAEATWLRQALRLDQRDEFSDLFIVVGGTLGPRGHTHAGQAASQSVSRFREHLREAAGHATEADPRPDLEGSSTRK